MDSDYKKSFHAATKSIEYNRRIHLRDLRHCYSTLGLHGTGDATATQAALAMRSLRRRRSICRRRSSAPPLSPLSLV